MPDFPSMRVALESGIIIFKIFIILPLADLQWHLPSADRVLPEKSQLRPRLPEQSNQNPF